MPAIAISTELGTHLPETSLMMFSIFISRNIYGEMKRFVNHENSHKSSLNVKWVT